MPSPFQMLCSSKGYKVIHISQSLEGQFQKKKKKTTLSLFHNVSTKPYLSEVQPKGLSFSVNKIVPQFHHNFTTNVVDSEQFLIQSSKQAYIYLQSTLSDNHQPYQCKLFLQNQISHFQWKVVVPPNKKIKISLQNVSNL